MRIFPTQVEVQVLRFSTNPDPRPRAGGTGVGPLISAAHRDRVDGFVRRAAAAGAQALCGGVRGSGFGKDMGQESVAEYSVTRHIMLKHAAPGSRDAFRPA